MGFVRATTIHILKRDVVARLASYTTGSSGASVSLGRMRESTPPARGLVGAFVGMVPKGVAIGVPSLGVEAQAALGPIC